MTARVNGVNRITSGGTAETGRSHRTGGGATIITAVTVTVMMITAAGLWIDKGTKMIITPMGSGTTMTEVGREIGVISTAT